MAISNQDFDFIRNLINQSAGIVLDPGKEYLVESRLRRLAHSEGFEQLEHLLAKLREDSWSIRARYKKKLIEALTTRETLFFRDQKPFEALRTHALPELKARRAKERALNIWSAACSSGQEPYSIAMILRRDFPELGGWALTMIASDISEDALAAAREGRYSQHEAKRGLSLEHLREFFSQESDAWQIKENIRRMIEFRTINLIDHWSALPPMDIIFMRNVLIYFDEEATSSIISRARRQLRPGGFLFLDLAKNVPTLNDFFEEVDLKAGCFRLRG